MAPRKSSQADCGQLALALATIRGDLSVNTACVPPPVCLFESVYPTKSAFLLHSLFQHVLFNLKIKNPAFFPFIKLYPSQFYYIFACLCICLLPSLCDSKSISQAALLHLG